MMSIKVAGWVGLAGIVLTMYTGDGSAVEVARVQPMKLAAMEGLYNGKAGQGLVAFGILDPNKKLDVEGHGTLFSIDIPYGLSILANHDANSFVPGINDIIAGRSFDAQGNPVNTVSYADRIAIGREAREALAAFKNAEATGDTLAMDEARAKIKDTFQYFGYGYFSSPEDAVPPVGLSFYSFHIMVIGGGYLMLLMIVALWFAYKKPEWLERRWIQWVGVLSIPVVWIVSEAGWVLAEMGRQPWVIQDLMPTRAAVSAVTATSVQITFWIFVVVFVALMAAEISIMVKEIKKASNKEILN